MRSRELTSVFNRALIDSAYRQSLFGNLKRTLLEGGVPQDEVVALERLSPNTLDQLAEALEALHYSAFEQERMRF